jgi:hypothetical protein
MSSFDAISTQIRKPIFYRGGYHLYMDTTTPTHRSYLSFYVETDPIGTLEQVLAIIRRLGMELRNLRAQKEAKGLAVYVCLAAEDEDAIITCRKRLQNVIGILAVRESADAMQVLSQAPLIRQHPPAVKPPRTYN